MDKTLAPSSVASIIASHARERRRLEIEGAALQKARAVWVGKQGPLPLIEVRDAGTPSKVQVAMSFGGDGAASASYRGDGAPDGAEVVGLEIFLKPEKIHASTHVPAATVQPYPPAFDRDVMRWIPVIVPLLGVAMVLLTGAMWTVVG